jgi:putative ABC transport system ATP-binding protein
MKERRAVIELRDVWKTYRMGDARVDALKGMNIKIFEGEFVSIQGPSGSGKSTLMYLIGCLDLPTKGHIFLDGWDISKLDESELAVIRGRKIGFVFQAFNLINTLNADENVALPMVFQNVMEEEKTRKTKELLGLVGLAHRAKHRPTQMSGGEMQRVAIARALANDPQIILADEPTGNLDSTNGHAIMSLLVDLHKKQGRTIIVVTHDPYIAKYAERRINLVDGCIAHDHQLEKAFIWENNRK